MSSKTQKSPQDSQPVRRKTHQESVIPAKPLYHFGPVGFRWNVSGNHNRALLYLHGMEPRCVKAGIETQDPRLNL